MRFDKAEIFWESSASVCVNRPAMKTLAFLAERFGMDAVYGRLVDGDYHTIAEWIFNSRCYDGPTVSELEDGLMEGGAFNIEVYRYDRVYRVGPDGDDVVYHVVKGDKSMRLEVRDEIRKHIEEMPGYVEGKPLLQNMYNVFATNCRTAHCKAICNIRPGEREEELPGMPEPQPEVQTQTVVRETVIVKEQPAELEGLLRKALIEQLVKLNLDEVHETVKSRLIDDFGFEPQRHVVKIAEVEHEVDEVLHEKFDEACHYVANDIPCFFYGPAGSGKGVLGRQIAKALGLDYHFMTSVTDEFKINGYMDAYGTYHETPFYKAFKDGGVFFLDEMDASAPEVLVCLNMAISDRRYTFPHETLEAHPDFRVLAAGNTLGTGADASYTGRMQLDAASLNRFVIVEVDYDERIDLLCAQGDQELVDFAKEFRKAVKAIGLPSVCSYRNITQLKVAEAAIPLVKAFQSCLCKEMNQDDINIVAEKMSGSNRWFQAFKNVKSIVG